MNASEVTAALKLGIGLVEQLSAAAPALGNPGVTAAAKVSSAVADFAQVALDTAQNGVLVGETQDIDRMRDMAATLIAQNDALAAEIAAS